MVSSPATYILFWLLVSFSPSIQVSFFPKTLNIVSGGSIKLILKSEAKLNCKECIIETPGNITFIITKETFSDEILIIENNKTDKLQWKNLETCSVILSDVSKSIEGKWGISCKNDGNNIYKSSSQIYISSIKSNSSSITSNLGSFTYIDCTEKSGINPKHCTILNPKNEVVIDDCKFYIDPVTPNDEGIWTCRMGFTGSMEELYHKIQLSINSKEHTIGHYKETEKQIKLACSLHNSNFKISWCRAWKPNGVPLMLTEGFLTERYSSLETDLTEKVCSLEIMLPLLPETDLGRWRIDMADSKNDFTGCFFDLPHNRSTISPSLPNGKKHLIVKSGTTVQFKYSIPWPIKYCYAKMPNGTLVNTHSSAKRMQQVGVCIIEYTGVTEEMAGQWTIGMPSLNSSEEILFQINLTVIAQKIISEQYFTFNKSKSSIILLCKSPIKSPMSYCRFMSPSGKGYNVPSNSLKNSRVSYYGSGLIHGECGIQINNFQPEDIGMWICAVGFETELTDEERLYIFVENLGQASAFTIGMSIGGVFVLVFIFAVIVYAYRKIRSYRHIDSRRSSNNSDEPLAVINTIPMYTLDREHQE